MKTVVLLLCCGLILSAPMVRGVNDREHEDMDRQEKPSFNVQKTIQGFCLKIKDNFMRGTVVARNAEHLSIIIVQAFDQNDDRCISNNEIRDLAAKFRGDLYSYRMLFEQTLDEDRDGCVSPGELNPLVLDCIIPSASWMKGNPQKFLIPFDSEERHEELRKQYEDEHEPPLQPIEEEKVEEDEAINEEEEEEPVRPVVLPATVKPAGLPEAMKEMLCSSTHERYRDLEVSEALRSLINEADMDMTGDLNFDEFFEVLSWIKIGRDETDDIASIIDKSKDKLITYEELFTAVDGCPKPETKFIPIVNTRPMIPKDQTPCPEPSDIFKRLQSRVAGYGSDVTKYGSERQLVAKIYSDITGDMESMISPDQLDVPFHCVQETLGDLDNNKDGFIDLDEFSGIAYDLMEKFVPRRESKEPRASREPFLFDNRVKLEGDESKVLLGAEEVHGRSSQDRNNIVFEIISEAAFNVLTQMREGKFTKESVYEVTGLLMENRVILDAVTKLSEGPYDRAVKKAAGIILQELRNMGY